jgi:hypothetical protein
MKKGVDPEPKPDPDPLVKGVDHDPDPDPHQNVKDPQHCTYDMLVQRVFLSFNLFFLTSSPVF